MYMLERDTRSVTELFMENPLNLFLELFDKFAVLQRVSLAITIC